MNKPDLLRRVLDLTLQMEHAAQMDDWQSAARLTRERNPLLMSLGRPKSPEALAAIERIRNVTVAVNQRAETACSELSAEYRAAMSKTSGVAAYQRGAGF
ncbi:flagellar protein FliT [Paraburkholderia dinghuensis]|uniref:Flagellar protein FliT n=1 Tax=Paraburkholderia dinghuensis TaxID=2305225 RepID=A0A3N6MVT6_9BURK|nr:flagellar protein FliT [Paraburkholderia dinghuensis]RQH06065.1 flagellar protein FliT [Paraburkholderia dinghuensis]